MIQRVSDQIKEPDLEPELEILFFLPLLLSRVLIIPKASGIVSNFSLCCFVCSVKITHSMLYLVAQSCLILCYPLDCSLPGFSVHEDSLGKNTGVGCHAFLQGIFLIQESNPGLLHCRILQVDSLPAELPGKPNIFYVDFQLLIQILLSCGSFPLSSF